MGVPTTAAAPAATDAPPPARAGRRKRTEVPTAALFLLPSLLIFAVFIVYPLGRTVQLSFYGNDIFGSPTTPVGFEHYNTLFSDPAFGTTLITTLLFVLFTVIPSIVLALLIALLLHRQIHAVKFFRTAFALPFAFSVSTASVVFGLMYNPTIGVLNGVLTQFGFDRVDWLTSRGMALVSVSIATVWMSLGYNMLVISAGLGSVDDKVLEAAELDGARSWTMMRSILIPLLTPQLFFLVVVNTIQALQSFGQIHILTRGGPAGSTTTLVYSIYQNAFANNASNFGYASAQALVLMFIVVAITAVQFGLLERKVFYS